MHRQQMGDYTVFCRLQISQSRFYTVSQVHEYFVVDNDLLYRQNNCFRQYVLPSRLPREEVHRIGYTIPWAGHLGFMETL